MSPPPEETLLTRWRGLEVAGFIFLLGVGSVLLTRLLWDPMMVRRPLLEPNLSMGGLTGQWLGVNALERVSSLALADTSAHFPPADMWDERIRTVSDGGMAPLSELTLERFFTRRFHQAQPATIELFRHIFQNMEPAGYPSS